MTTSIYEIIKLGNAIEDDFKRIEENLKKSSVLFEENNDSIKNLIEDQQKSANTSQEKIEQNASYVDVISQMVSWADDFKNNFISHGSSSIIPLTLDYTQRRKRDAFCDEVQLSINQPNIILTKPHYKSSTKADNWSDEAQKAISNMNNQFSKFIQPEAKAEEETNFQIRGTEKKEEKTETVSAPSPIEDVQKTVTTKKLFSKDEDIPKSTTPSSIADFRKKRNRRQVSPISQPKNKREKERIERTSPEKIVENIQRMDVIKPAPELPPLLSAATATAAATAPDGKDIPKKTNSLQMTGQATASPSKAAGNATAPALSLGFGSTTAPGVLGQGANTTANNNVFYVGANNTMPKTGAITSPFGAIGKQ